MVQTRYPVVIALDAPGLARVAAGAAEQLRASGSLPPVIVIGVENPSSSARNRDLTPAFVRRSDDDDAAMGASDDFTA